MFSVITATPARHPNGTQGVRLTSHPNRPMREGDVVEVKTRGGESRHEIVQQTERVSGYQFARTSVASEGCIAVYHEAGERAVAHGLTVPLAHAVARLALRQHIENERYHPSIVEATGERCGCDICKDARVQLNNEIVRQIDEFRVDYVDHGNRNCLRCHQRHGPGGC